MFIQFIINITLLAFMGATAIAILRVRNLFAVAMLSGIYSFLAATVFVLLDAVDVAFTEAAVGAGVSTVLMLGALSLIGENREKVSIHTPILPLIVVTITGVALLYGVSDMPAFADPEAPANKHVAPYYLEESKKEIGVPNVVTSILSSYRGYDTLGETGVIFTAGIAVMSLLGGTFWRRRRPRKKEDPTGDGG